MSDKQVGDLTRRDSKLGFSYRGKPTYREQKEINTQLTDRLAHDTLTKLSSRAELEARLKRIEDQDTVASLLLMDIDFFKKVNDTHGHNVGDEVLQKVSERLRRHVKDQDIVGRWGGEEFIIIIDGLSSNEVLEKRADEIRMEVGNEPLKLENDLVLNKTISIGATVRREGEKFEDWVKRADDALYEAKESGRNRVKVAE